MSEHFHVPPRVLASAVVVLGVDEPVAAKSRTARGRAVNRAVREVVGYQGNTPSVCRASYINLSVIELFEEGRTTAPVLDRLGADVRLGEPATPGPVEEAVLGFSPSSACHLTVAGTRQP